MRRQPDVPVAAVRAQACTVATDQPEADGTLAWDSTTLVLVEVDADGRTGLGWTYAPAAAVAVVHGELEPVVVGADALAPAATNGAMARAVRNAGRRGLAGTAISAVDIALWDLCARLHDLPLHRLWGGPVGPVHVYGSGGFTTYADDRLRDQVRSWLALGLDAVKIKIGESWGAREDRDLARVATTCHEAGGRASVMVDANGAYDRSQALRVGGKLDDLGVVWFEEPVSSEDLDGLRSLRERLSCDVTAGEYGYDLDDLARTARSVDCLQVDATRCGGYTEWMRAAAVAAGQHVGVSGHCAPYLTAPVAAVTPNLRHLEWFHDHVRIEQRFFEGADDPVDGALVLPPGPGHGLVLRRAEVEALRVA